MEMSVNQVKQSIYSMIDNIHTEDELIRIHRFIQVIYVHKKVRRITESTHEEILQRKIDESSR